MSLYVCLRMCANTMFFYNLFLFICFLQFHFSPLMKQCFLEFNALSQLHCFVPFLLFPFNDTFCYYKHNFIFHVILG